MSKEATYGYRTWGRSDPWLLLPEPLRRQPGDLAAVVVLTLLWASCPS